MNKTTHNSRTVKAVHELENPEKKWIRGFEYRSEA
jgi:hypothetical protein